MTTWTPEMLSTEQVDKRLRDGVIVQSTPAPGGLVWNRATPSLDSNNLIEDAGASAIVERDQTETGPQGDLLLFAVMDDHVRIFHGSSISCRRNLRFITGWYPNLTTTLQNPRPGRYDGIEHADHEPSNPLIATVRLGLFGISVISSRLAVGGGKHP